jgi:heme exporter protein CcmD
VTPESVAEPQGIALLLHFLAMGGHALYVWLSYGAALLVVVYLVWSSRRRERAWVRQARAQLQRRAVGSVPVAPAGDASPVGDDPAAVQHRPLEGVRHE